MPEELGDKTTGFNRQAILLVLELQSSRMVAMPWLYDTLTLARSGHSFLGCQHVSEALNPDCHSSAPVGLLLGGRVGQLDSELQNRSAEQGTRVAGALGWQAENFGPK